MDYSERLRQLGCEAPAESPKGDTKTIEMAIWVSLPEPYRKFLAECGGWWKDICCPCQEPTPFGEHVITGFHDAAEVLGLVDSMITPRNMITIGYGHFGAYTCLSVAGIDRGSVYALDSEFRVYWSDEYFHQRFNALANCIQEYLDLRREDRLSQKPAGYDSLYLLASDLDEFLNRCRRCSDDD